MRSLSSLWVLVFFLIWNFQEGPVCFNVANKHFKDVSVLLCRWPRWVSPSRWQFLQAKALRFFYQLELSCGGSFLMKTLLFESHPVLKSLWSLSIVTNTQQTAQWFYQKKKWALITLSSHPQEMRGTWKCYLLLWMAIEATRSLSHLVLMWFSLIRLGGWIRGQWPLPWNHMHPTLFGVIQVWPAQRFDLSTLWLF